MAEFYLPTLHAFAMDNIFTGSSGDFRFRAVPRVVKPAGSKEVDMEASSIFAECWHGPYCCELSQMEDSATFPMSEAGREALRAWLIAHI